MKTITGKFIALAIAVSGIIFSSDVMAACNVPTGQNTSAITSTSATLNWTAPSGGAQSYNLRYRVVNSPTWITATSSTVSKTITSLTAASNYEWQVQSKCSGTQTSSWTASSTFTTLIACNTPTGLSTTSIATTSATLNWAAVSGATGYNVQYRITGAPSWTPTTATSNSKSLSGLTSGSNYEWQVQTNCGSSNVSSFTSSSTFSTLVVPCGLPSGLSASGITATDVTLNWTAVSGAAGYNVQYRIVGAPSWISTTSTTNSKALTSLSGGSNYEWKVQSNCGNSNLSAFTASSTFSTLIIPCGLPASLNATAITQTDATLGWTSVSGALSYNVQYRIAGAPSWTSVPSATNPLTITALTPTSNYEWQVQGNCGNSNISAFTSTSTFSTLASACIVPIGLNTNNITFNSADLTWDAVTGAAGYNVQYRITGSPSWNTTSSTSNSVTLTGLTSAEHYQWQVQTDCGSSAVSSFSSIEAFTILPAPVCSEPNEISIGGLTESMVILDWSQVAGVAVYNIQYRQVGSGSWIDLSSPKSEIVISGLNSSGTYEWHVRTDCGNYNFSPYSKTGTFTMLSHAPSTTANTNLLSGTPVPNDPSTWIALFVSSGTLAGDEQIVHDWLLAHGCIDK